MFLTSRSYTVTFTSTTKPFIRFGSSKLFTQIKHSVGQKVYKAYVLLDVCLSVHRCICVEKKNQLDATERFIALIICSTCFGNFYAHHQELEAICVLLPPMMCDALVVGGQMQDSRLCVRDEGCCSSNINHPESIACCPVPDLQ